MLIFELERRLEEIDSEIAARAAVDPRGQRNDPTLRQPDYGPRRDIERHISDERLRLWCGSR